MDQFDSVQVGSSEADTCGKCGMHKGENECCFDEVKIVKLNASHVFSEVLVSFFSLPHSISLTTDFLLIPLDNFIKEQSYYLTHSPPLISEQKTYLQNRVFRI